MLNAHFTGGEVSTILGSPPWKAASSVADSWGVEMGGSTARPPASRQIHDFLSQILNGVPD